MLVKFIFSSLIQLENIYDISVTFEVSISDISIVVKFEQPLNKYRIFLTCDVFIFPKLISFKSLQLLNI